MHLNDEIVYIIKKRKEKEHKCVFITMWRCKIYVADRQCEIRKEKII